jgi:DNA-binding IclR family transcriptional regulator
MTASNSIIAIIELLATTNEPKRLTQISNKLSISNGTAHRVLSSLRDAQWLARDSKTKKYTIGIHLLEIALLIISQVDWRKISLSYLEKLSRELNESVYLTSRVGLERMYIEQVHGQHELRQFVELGKRLPLWQGAPGKAIMAYLDDSDIEMLVNQMREAPIGSFASGRPIRITKLRKELCEIKRKGFAMSSEERIAGLNSVAAPIFDRNRTVIGSISVGGPIARFSSKKAQSCAPLVLDTANSISAKLLRWSQGESSH